MDTNNSDRGTWAGPLAAVKPRDALLAVAIRLGFIAFQVGAILAVLVAFRAVPTQGTALARRPTAAGSRRTERPIGPPRQRGRLSGDPTARVAEPRSGNM